MGIRLSRWGWVARLYSPSDSGRTLAQKDENR
jgi:hypothetical protein